MDEVTVKGLLGIGVMVLAFGVPMTWLKMLEYFEAHRIPAFRRLAGIDWLDPEIRRN